MMMLEMKQHRWRIGRQRGSESGKVRVAQQIWTAIQDSARMSTYVRTSKLALARSSCTLLRIQTLRSALRPRCSSDDAASLRFTERQISHSRDLASDPAACSNGQERDTCHRSPIRARDTLFALRHRRPPVAGHRDAVPALECGPSDGHRQRGIERAHARGWTINQRV
jgi:hypothetical protein